MSDHPPAPPRFWESLLRLVLPDDVVGRSIAGDLDDEYRLRVKVRPKAARWWYRREALGIAARSLVGAVLPGGQRVNPRARMKGRERRDGDPMLQVILRDVRYSMRALMRAPRFTVLAVLTLALGIGSNTAIFSAVNGVLLRPLPYPDSDRIVGVWHGAPDLGYDQFGISPGIFHQYLSENQVYEAMGLYISLERNLTQDGDAERVQATASTHGLFDVLGVSPLMGRTYTEDEATVGGSAVVVLSHGLWQRRFGGDPGIVGQSMMVDGHPTEIIGVMPRGFDFGGPTREAEIWLPLHVELEDGDPGNFSFSGLARLREDVTVEAAEAQMAALTLRVRERWADVQDLINFLDAGGFHPIVHSLHEEVVGNLRRPLWILLGTVGFVLLIACANVANLFLVRAEGRQREMAVRTALGATRGTLVRQLLTESVILAGIGGGVGLALAWVGTPALLGFAPPELPRLDEISMDASVLGFTVGVTALAALLFGAAPALRYDLAGLLGMLRYAGRGTTEGRERLHLRNVLVVGQTALAMVLLVGSGLLVQSFREIRQADVGFDAGGVLTFSLSLPWAGYPGAVAEAQFHQQLLERLRALPGVQHAGGVSALPLGGRAAGTAYEIEDFPTGPDELPPMFWYKYATPGYFDAMGISVVAGRGFRRADHERNFGNIIVSKALADRFWPNQDPLGRRIRASGDTSEVAWGRIVGVVESVRDRGIREEPGQTVYWPMVGPRGDEGWSVPTMTYAIQAENPSGIMGPARQAVWDIDPDLPIAGMETMVEVVADSEIRLTFTMLALGIAAFMALVLGAVGLYGVLSYVVSQRIQEIGVRMALGAERGRVQTMVVASGAKLAGAGLVVGLLGAGALTRLLQGLLYGTEPLDPVTFGGTSVVLLCVGLVASFLPARRAATVDPVESMRAE